MHIYDINIVLKNWCLALNQHDRSLYNWRVHWNSVSVLLACIHKTFVGLLSIDLSWSSDTLSLFNAYNSYILKHN